MLHIGCPVVLRTDGRTGVRSYGWTSDVIAKSKFVAFMVSQIFLAMGSAIIIINIACACACEGLNLVV